MTAAVAPYPLRPRALPRSPRRAGPQALTVGIDIGTSGVRAVAVDWSNQVVAEARAPLPPPQRDGARVAQDPWLWWAAVEAVVAELTARVPAQHIEALAVDGTSGTVLLTDAAHQPLGEALMYSDAHAVDEAAAIAGVAPADHPARGATSPLARLLRLQRRFGDDRAAQRGPGAAAHRAPRHLQHQADWVAGRLAGRAGLSDDTNALKLGHDPATGRWPDWFDALGVRREWLPQVHAPGHPIGRVDAAIAQRLGLAPATLVASGCTDGVAAVLATPAAEPGDAVTSLGSTLVLKQLATAPVVDVQRGVYSHRLGSLWLPGGASNTGGAALARWFTPVQLAELSAQLLQRADEPSGLDYHPLPAIGERFPVADAAMRSRTDPRPAEDLRFLHGLLEGIARVEAEGYRCLGRLGAPPPRRVFTVGTGAGNGAWTRIRQRVLGVPVQPAPHGEAAVGAARLARWAADACR